jgi:hypothetical protein
MRYPLVSTEYGARRVADHTSRRFDPHVRTAQKAADAYREDDEFPQAVGHIRGQLCGSAISTVLTPRLYGLRPSVNPAYCAQRTAENASSPEPRTTILPRTPPAAAA